MNYQPTRDFRGKVETTTTMKCVRYKSWREEHIKKSRVSLSLSHSTFTYFTVVKEKMSLYDHAEDKRERIIPHTHSWPRHCVGWMVNVTPQPRFTPVMDLRYPLDRQTLYWLSYPRSVPPLWIFINFKNILWNTLFHVATRFKIKEKNVWYKDKDERKE
jgi:hypothetical protein